MAVKLNGLSGLKSSSKKHFNIFFHEISDVE